MTEYDYSPDAVERYIAKQNSVARWVDSQEYQKHAYRNPFVPDPKDSANARDGRNLSRSVSTPPVDPYARHARPSTAHKTSHRDNRDPYRGIYSSNGSSQTQSTAVPTVHRYSSGGTHSRSHSQSQSIPTTHRVPAPPSRSRTYAYAQGNSGSSSTTHLPASSRSPVRSQTLPAQPMATQYTSAPGQTVVMQNGRQTYVVVPPHGTRVQVCSPTSQPVSPTYAYPQGQQVYYASQPVSPTNTSKQKQPFLKRIFSGNGGSGSGSNSGSNSSYARRMPVYAAQGERRRTTSMHY
ncbi:uncharacterized protein FOMMEDRAFT_16804 [Fomitiporia mediterranea MF3/22]|uniref:uncharacterized protein n=1 Tax=Fomitiporia mediterranea (strain MF3/22) TaxID=694068 RepID=UPI000440739A|nr:uncharacterized protein FOMMEDRAFT_16804 [Fomitiporia mediterranea MF3/22]EJD08443.1 hypothetical protein FOMMEDRAFT_16804 [Fomitiporia mediterranea MF3/22]